MKKALKAGLALAVVGTIFSASPAFSAPINPTDGAPINIGPANGEWRWDSEFDLSLDGPFSDVWTTEEDTWDSTEATLWGSDDTTSAAVVCADPADLSTAPDGSGDIILTCIPQVIDNGDGEISVQAEMRFYADGQTVRQRYILTNNGTSSVSGQVLAVNYNAYQDDSIAISWTSTAGSTSDWATSYGTIPEVVTTPEDLVWITDCREDFEFESPVVKYAVGATGATTTLANDVERNWVSGGQGYYGNDNTNSFFELPDIAAGQTIEIVTLAQVFLFDPSTTTAVSPMNSWQTATYNAVQSATADTSLTSDAVVFAGIEDSSRVLNWSTGVSPTPEPTPEPELAKTGSSIELLLGASVLAAAAGALSLLIRRRVAIQK